MARNKLGDLNNHLFEAVERLMDDSLSSDELKKEVSRARAVSEVSSSIVEVASLGLKASLLAHDKMTAKTAYETLPASLGGKDA